MHGNTHVTVPLKARSDAEIGHVFTLVALREGFPPCVGVVCVRMCVGVVRQAVEVGRPSEAVTTAPWRRPVVGYPVLPRGPHLSSRTSRVHFPPVLCAPVQVFVSFRKAEIERDDRFGCPQL